MLFTRTKYSNDATIATSVSAQHTDVWVTQKGTSVPTGAKVANASCKVLCYTSPVDVVPSDANGTVSAIKPSVASPNAGTIANPNEVWFLHKTSKFLDTGDVTATPNGILRWTSVSNQTDVWIQMIAAGSSQPLSVSVSGRTVIVHLATSPTGAVTSTASAVITAVTASVAASALVTVANQGTSTGAGVVRAQALTEITRLLHGANWVVNISNRGAQDATIANMLAKNASGGPWDGAFLDNLWTDLRYLSPCAEFSNAAGSYPNTWQTAYMGWLDYVIPQLHTAGIATIVGNISTTAISFLVTGGVYTSGSKIWNAYLGSADGVAAPTLERCDGAMFESWADGGLGPQQQQAISPAQSVLDNEIACAKYCQTNSKSFLGHSYFTRRLGTAGASLSAQTAQTVRRYALVEALLVGDPRAGNGYAMVGLNAGTTDDNPLWITEFDQALLLGAPSGAATRNGDGSYQRTFANGSVYWNPTNATSGGVPAFDSTLTVTAVTAPTNSVAPVASGTTSIGDVLSTTNGTWANTPTSFTYQWQRGGVDIGSATASTYQLISADASTTVRCVVTATNAGGSASANSNGIAIPASSGTAPVNLIAPVVSGSLTVGGTLTGTTGTWSGNPTPTFTYQWQRDVGNGLQNIPGATAPAYVIQRTDLGASLTIVVTALNATGVASATASNSLRLITRRILIDENGQIADTELPPRLVRDRSATPIGIDSTGITDGQHLVYDAASGLLKPGA